MAIEYWDKFFPPSAEETEMARLLDLIDAEWRSDPSSVACFDLRIMEDVRKALASFKEREEKAKRELRRAEHRQRRL
jgi:hypothetical protein